MTTVPPSPEDQTAAGRATAILSAASGGRSLAPFGQEGRPFGFHEAYEVAAEVRRRREDRGERVVGRKIGFTNTTIWAEYNVGAPIWGYVYDTTLHRLSEVSEPVPLTSFVEPRIEPEIVFRLARAPAPGMDERELLSCIAWSAFGFEIVHSLFPGWRFAAPDTVAAFGLHGALYVGEPATVTPDRAAAWDGALRSFAIELRRNGVAVETGRASNVLRGGPLSALRHLVQVLAGDPGGPALAAGEIVTTGTLTNAYPITAGERWSATLAGIPLPNAELSF